MNSKIVIFIIFSLVFVASFYFISPKQMTLQNNCSIQESECHFQTKGLQFKISLSPLPINPLKDLTYKLKLLKVPANENINNIEFFLLGHSMKMPETLHFKLNKLSQDSYQAKRTFPTCTEELMLWRLNAKIETNLRTINTHFELKIKNNRRVN